ncbi:putative P-loop ATPase fused to an acetyltransferase [Caulobacter sp. AP07]|uniref:GNAT family N-acetyltransferase n=1 Tax=Caulobacter sp. AP07 TaxID=1144304 RepID=UPI000271DA6F|nr:GNAT family N-acetyltransferase [Caulobacter sp. AP07]EJL24170.1 putative P-loop ATPase fused to an acetyltransferase [Caulobacter sp. AP07]
MIQLIRIIDDLPDGFPALLADAAKEGVRNMALLAQGWAGGDQCFDGDGEALLGALLAGALAGVGGLSIESDATEPALRVRRFYVRPDFRRQGVARTLASALIQEGLDQVDLLTVNAAASPAAAPFWETQGFSPDATGPWTHVLRRSAT